MAAILRHGIQDAPRIRMVHRVAALLSLSRALAPLAPLAHNSMSIVRRNATRSTSRWASASRSLVPCCWCCCRSSCSRASHRHCCSFLRTLPTSTPLHATPLHSAHPFDAGCSSRVASMTRWCHTSSDRRSHKSTWWPTFSRISSATVWPPAHDLNLAILTTSDASLADEFPALERYPSVGDINNYAVDPTREQPIKAGTYHDEPLPAREPLLLTAAATSATPWLQASCSKP